MNVISLYVSLDTKSNRATLEAIINSQRLLCCASAQTLLQVIGQRTLSLLRPVTRPLVGDPRPATALCDPFVDVQVPFKEGQR